jgi:hypothetical protein
MGQIARLTLGPLVDQNDGAHDRLATHSPAPRGAFPAPFKRNGLPRLSIVTVYPRDGRR